MNAPDRITSTTPEYYRSRSTRDENGCWIWRLGLDRDGYGRVRFKRAGYYPAHRAAYQVFVGPIPDGMTIDHACFQRACINPDHLRPLTHEENSRRQRSAEKTHCVNGHRYTPENTYVMPSGRRDCRTCIRQRVAAYRSRKAS